MITVLVGACCTLSFMVGKNSEAWTAAALPVSGFMALTFWTLTGLDAKDTRVVDAKDALEALGPAVRDNVYDPVSGGQTIEAIKELRAATGLVLAEAKAIVDRMRHNQQVSSDRR